MLIPAMIAITVFLSGCGDSATPPASVEPPSTFRLVVSPERNPEAGAEVELDRIDHIAVLAVRSAEGAIDLRVDDRVDPGLSVTNETGEEVRVSLFRDGTLVAEVPLPDDRTEVFGDSP